MALFKRKAKVETLKEESTVSILSTSNDNTADDKQKNSNNDYANAVFLHWLSFSAKPIFDNPDDYPRYIKYELQIYDPIKKHQEFLNDGYLEIATSEEILEKYKVADLKDVLNSFNLSDKGKKQELIDRILSEINSTDLQLSTLYTVSEKGQNYIKQHEDFIKLHGNPYNISYEEYIDAKSNSATYLKFNDIIWSIFNMREIQCPIHDHGTRRNNFLHMAIFLKKENRFIDSLYHYMTVLFYDLYQWGLDDPVAPAIINEIFELKEYYSDELLDRCYKRVNFKPNISKDTFRDILNDIFSDGELNLSDYKEQLL